MRNITIKDVAKKAGVSVATVSRAMQNKGVISPSTKMRVLDVAKELNYRVDLGARGLKKKQTKSIGLCICNICNPFYPPLVRGVENTINKFGYSLVICNTEENPKTEEAYLNVMLEQRVDGLIITPTWNLTVCVDNVHGARTAVEHLILLGHKRIGLIGGPKMISTTQERVQGYLEALRKYDLKKDKKLMVDGGSSIEGGMKAMADLLELPSPPTAVFGYNNVVTLGALLTLKQRNKKIPKDLAILGFDEVEWAGVVDPPLTVVSQPVYAIGATAGQLIMQRLLNEGPKDKQKIVLKTELIIRKSCGFKA
jgi:LacI family transcriptional regulator